MQRQILTPHYQELHLILLKLGKKMHFGDISTLKLHNVSKLMNVKNRLKLIALYKNRTANVTWSLKVLYLLKSLTILVVCY